jgi:hypothetical protein
MNEAGSVSILDVPVESETPTQRKVNLAFAGVLIVTIIALWIHFA